MYLLKDASYFQKWWWVSVRELNRLLAAAIWGAAVLARQWVCSYSGMLGGKSTYNSVCKESLRCGKRNVQSSVGVWGGGIKPWEPWERIFFQLFFSVKRSIKNACAYCGRGQERKWMGRPSPWVNSGGSWLLHALRGKYQRGPVLEKSRIPLGGNEVGRLQQEAIFSS